MADKKDLMQNYEDLLKDITTLSGIIDNLKSLANSNKDEINELERSLALLEQQVENFRRSLAAAAVADAKVMLRENADKIMDEKFEEMRKFKKDAEETLERLTREIVVIKEKIEVLYRDVRNIAKDIVQEELDKSLTGGIKEKVSEATRDLLDSLIGKKSREEIDQRLAQIEKESGIEKSKVYAVAIDQAISTIATSIATNVLSRVNMVSDDKPIETPEEIEPFDRDKELVHKNFDKLLTCVEAGVIPMLVGPAGTGKSTAVEQVARKLGLKFYTMNRIQNAFELTGYNDAEGKYVSTQFYEAYTKGGIFFFDEIDASSPEALVTINTAIAQGYMAFPNGLVKMHPDFKVVAAGNTFGKGANRQYCGRNSLDSATLDRFMIIEWDYDRELEAKIINDKELLEFAWAVRDAIDTNRLQIIISTRGIIATKKIIEASKGKEGFTLEEALEGNLFENVSIDALNQIIDQIDKDTPISNNKYYKALVRLKDDLVKKSKR